MFYFFKIVFQKIVICFKNYVTKSTLISIKKYEEREVVRVHTCVCVLEGSRRMDQKMRADIPKGALPGNTGLQTF